ncbi:hypothetical protein B0H12DRAFT_660137 [Mycena haematopus]|nr:hypothetical protein B0H12DRAFT_660137 [Mycena haematopus]
MGLSTTSFRRRGGRSETHLPTHRPPCVCDERARQATRKESAWFPNPTRLRPLPVDSVGHCIRRYTRRLSWRAVTFSYLLRMKLWLVFHYRTPWSSFTRPFDAGQIHLHCQASGFSDPAWRNAGYPGTAPPSTSDIYCRTRGLTIDDLCARIVITRCAAPCLPQPYAMLE